MTLRNDVSTTQLQGPKIVSTLSYENIVQKAALMKHFTGLKPSQFEVLHDFLDDVCPLETINYWKSKDCPATEKTRSSPKSDFSPREKLFICLLRLKRGFTLKMMMFAYLRKWSFETPETMADRGFTVQDLLSPLQVQLKFSLFLKGRKSFSAAKCYWKRVALQKLGSMCM